MLNQAEIFKEKMNFILEKVCGKDIDKFVHLFYIQGGNIPFENRKYHIKKNWLNKATNPRKFTKEYELYPFSSLKFHNRPLFRDGYEFLTIELEEFKKIVENYITPIIPEDLHYTHMYVFSVYGIEKNNIGFYRIEHLNHKNGEIEIKVTPPNNKTSLQLEPYKGSLKQQGNKLILTFQNRDDYISAIFNLELINKRTDKLVGIGIGIADINQKIPIAKKVILTKKAVENVDELYLSLNESEIISANENFYEYNYTKEEEFNQIHLKRYIKKIEQMNSLFYKLSEQNYFNSFYQQLAYQELLATHKIFQKVKNDHSYYVYDRKRILNILLKSYKTEPYNKLYIVMPTYKEDNIFEHQSTQAIILQNKLIKLSKKISIKIIFVIENCQKTLKKEFTTFLKKAKESIDIHFTVNKTVEQEVNSIDFCYTDRENFVVSKSLRHDISAFNLYQHQNTINEYHSMFRRIFNRSITYNEFIQNNSKICHTNKFIPKKLIGHWYHYINGSKKFWEDEVKIFENGQVEYYSEGKLTEKGKIINKEFQSVILLDCVDTKRLFTIVFDNQPYKLQKAFFTRNIAKQLDRGLYIYSTGILSRELIEIDKAKEILGNVDDVRILEDSRMIKRLTDYISDK